MTVQPAPVKQSIGDAFGDLDATIPVSPLSNLPTASQNELPKVDVASRDPIREPIREPSRDTEIKGPRSATSGPSGTPAISEKESVSPLSISSDDSHRATLRIVSLH